MTLPRHHTGEEGTQATRRLGEVLEVVAVSPPSPDRGASVHVAVDPKLRLGPAGTADAWSAAPARRPRP